MKKKEVGRERERERGGGGLKMRAQTNEDREEQKLFREK